eukprot:scaffold102515_cov63-Attheya_sp.AAC.7
MAFYQRQIMSNHENINRYKHILKNIQDCYNATRLKRRLDELQESTVEYSDELTAKKAKHEEPSSNLDIDMGLVDEAQDQDEGNFLFEKETDSITLETIRKYGKKDCGYNHITLPPCPLDSVIMGIELDAHTCIQTPNHFPEHERITFTKLIELSYKVDTSRRINPQQIAGDPLTHLTVMKPNGTKDSIIKWGTFYGLDTKQQGAFEVATSNFVLTYHVDAANADDIMQDFW